MKEKINIAEILKDKLENTKLYSPLFGDVYFLDVEDDIIKVIHQGRMVIFFGDGRYYNYPESEPLLFPSKEMQDWEKFSWKRGDVLVTEDGSTKAIFECFEDDTYLTFKGKYCLQKTNIDETFIVDTKENLTESFSLQAKNIAQIYIHNIEDRMGGILNKETLEIEKAQPEFKDGDIITFKDRIIIIYNTSIDKSPKRTEIYYHACLKEGELTVNEYLMSCGFGEGWYSSTEEEKHHLFEALANKGKAWDAEKKKVVDLPKKCEFKPFDKCVWKIQGIEGSIWQASFVSYVDKYGATPMGMSIDDLSNLIVLPYNKKTAHLLGTTDDWEGGEQ